MFNTVLRRFHTSRLVKGHTQYVSIGLGIPATNKMCERLDKYNYHIPLNIINVTEPCSIQSDSPILFKNYRNQEEGILFASPANVINVNFCMQSNIVGPLTARELLETYGLWFDKKDYKVSQLLKFLERKDIDINKPASNIYPHTTECDNTILGSWLYEHNNSIKNKLIKDFLGCYIQTYDY